MVVRAHGEGESDMEDEGESGAAKQVKGSLREAIGKVTGNAKAEARGAADKADGEARLRAGKAASARRETSGR